MRNTKLLIAIILKKVVHYQISHFRLPLDPTGLRGTNLDLKFKTGSCLFWNLKTSDTKNIYCKFLIGKRHLISGPPLARDDEVRAKTC